MFDDNSRYIKSDQYIMQDKRGRNVKVVATPAAPVQSILGYHLLKQGQRLDHLANKYLGNPAGFWKIAETNDAMLAETLSERSEIAIPNKQ